MSHNCALYYKVLISPLGKGLYVGCSKLAVGIVDALYICYSYIFIVLFNYTVQITVLFLFLDFSQTNMVNSLFLELKVR